MQRLQLCALSLVIACAIGSSASAQNLLANPSFEDPITFDGPPFVGSWEGFNGGGATAANSAAFPRTGALSFAGDIPGVTNTFAGTFQDVPGLVPGQLGQWSVWHATPTTAFSVVVEMRIEWRDSVGNVEISRTPNFTPVPVLNQYSQVWLVAAVPAGADTARVVYATQSFTAGNLGLIYVDDASFSIVPEPASLSLLGLGAVALVRRRR